MGIKRYLVFVIININRENMKIIKGVCLTFVLLLAVGAMKE